MITDITLNASLRDGIGKGFARRLRAKGLIPAALYGEGKDPVAVSINARELAQILRSETGHNSIFTLAVGDTETATVIIKDWFADPVKGKLLHADLMRLSMTTETRVKVGIDVEGEPTGVKLQGGILEFELRDVEVECLPGDIPERVTVDVSGLQIGDHVTVADLVYDRDKVKMITDEHHTIASVQAPRLVEEPTPVVAEGEAGSEPEVIKKGKTEE